MLTTHAKQIRWGVRTFSAEGRSIHSSLGHRPRKVLCANAPALKARFIPAAFSVHH